MCSVGISPVGKVSSRRTIWLGKYLSRELLGRGNVRRGTVSQERVWSGSCLDVVVCNSSIQNEGISTFCLLEYFWLGGISTFFPLIFSSLRVSAHFSTCNMFGREGISIFWAISIFV